MNPILPGAVHLDPPAIAFSVFACPEALMLGQRHHQELPTFELSQNELSNSENAVNACQTSLTSLAIRAGGKSQT